MNNRKRTAGFNSEKIHVRIELAIYQGLIVGWSDECGLK